MGYCRIAGFLFHILTSQYFDIFWYIYPKLYILVHFDGKKNNRKLFFFNSFWDTDVSTLPQLSILKPIWYINDQTLQPFANQSGIATFP